MALSRARWDSSSTAHATSEVTTAAPRTLPACQHRLCRGARAPAAPPHHPGGAGLQGAEAASEPQTEGRLASPQAGCRPRYEVTANRWSRVPGQRAAGTPEWAGAASLLPPHRADSRAPQVGVAHLRSLRKGQDRSPCVAPGHRGRHSGLCHASGGGQPSAGRAWLPPAGAGSSLRGGGAVLGAAGTSPDRDWTMWQPEPHEGAASREWATSHDGLVLSARNQRGQRPAWVRGHLRCGGGTRPHTAGPGPTGPGSCSPPSAVAAVDVGGRSTARPERRSTRPARLGRHGCPLGPAARAALGAHRGRSTGTPRRSPERAG